MADAGNQTPPRVLVVDDEESVRTFAARVLRESGYDVVLAADGLEALRIVEGAPPFDLFIVDVMMRELLGGEVARRLRQHHPDAKILYFTGHVDRLFAEKQVLWKDEAFLEKPVSINGLRQSVSLILFGHLHGPGRR